LCALAAAIFPASLTMDRMPRKGASLQTAMVEGHNAARQQAGQRPLAWDNALAASAATCAAQLARSDRFEHCFDGADGTGPGENLWMGTRSAYSYAAMVGAWVSERKLHHKIRPPNVRKKHFHEETGHYDQIVWPDTTLFGCAMVSSRTMDYLVCHYYPAGNDYLE
jgi:hypothetical protein